MYVEVYEYFGIIAKTSDAKWNESVKMDSMLSKE